ncbi:MAG: leucine-rich repeat protein [Acutalibacteraceae bacterium]|nr:leucine-rich repeat protein [Acutalibacteraceae bacterium]
MKVKKGIAVFLSVLMLCSVVFSTSAFAAIMSSKGFEFQRIDATTKAEIVGITSGSELESSPSITIPSSLNNFLIIRIATNAFKNNTVQEEIILPDTITEISNLAFNSAKALKTITIPNKVQSMGEFAFNNCNSLTNVTFKTTRLSILPRGTFYGCTSLDNVIIPSSVNTIESMAFAGCISLNKIYIPSTVSVIGNDTFLYDDNLTIYGTAGSSAHAYAQKKNIPFVELPENKSTYLLNNWLSSAEYVLSGDMSEYIPETAEKLQQEYESALAVKNDFFSTQSDIDNAVNNLSTAFKALKLIVMPQLEEAVENAKVLLENADIYTETSVNNLSKAVTTAEEIIQNISATSTEVKNMIALLNEKMNSLVLQSKVDLQALIENASKAVDNDFYIYTEASLSALTNALANANDVFEDVNSTDEIYKNEIEKLTQAYNSLVLLTIGDSTLDTNLDISDVICILKNIVNTIEFNERQQYVSDMNEDGKITVVDAILLQRLLLDFDLSE